MTGIQSLALCTLLAGPVAAMPAAPPVISPATPTPLVRHLAAEQPTVFVFIKPSSSLELTFAQELRAKAGAKVAFREIRLKSGDEPLAKQYEVSSTPTALIYDRRGRFVGRSSSASEITAMVTKAAEVMRIDWPEAGDPRYAEMEKVLGRAANSGIMRTMSFRPAWLKQISDLHRMEHQPDTALDRRTKEMIATYVSALNKCKF
jgi:hypothetical protein